MGHSLELVLRQLLSHTVLYLFPQCSPWPDVAYQVNSAPSPSYNGSPNSFGLGEGYVQPSFPWGSGMHWGRGSCLGPLPSSHGLASIWVLVWLTGIAIAAIFIYSLSDPHVGGRIQGKSPTTELHPQLPYLALGS